MGLELPNNMPAMEGEDDDLVLSDSDLIYHMKDVLRSAIQVCVLVFLTLFEWKFEFLINFQLYVQPSYPDFFFLLILFLEF